MTVVQKLQPKWSQNGAKMEPKCSQNVAKMQPKCSQRSQMQLMWPNVAKCSQMQPNVAKCSQMQPNVAKIQPKCMGYHFFEIVTSSKVAQMEQHTLKNVNNCSNTTIYSYSKTSGGQSSNPQLNVVHFFNNSVNQTSVAA